MVGGQQSYGYISRAQLDTIRSKVSSEAMDTHNEERMRLKQLSDTRAAQWPNTLEAQRARKERARAERAAAEETERIEADRSEAELRAEQRRIQIERANKILFDETDKVKTLHGKMLLCDAVKENEALIGFKKQISVLRKAQEAAFVEQQRQAMETAEAAELAKLEAMRQRALEQKTVQLQQLEDMKTRILSERADDKKEGLLMKQRALEEESEMRAKAGARMAKSKQLSADTKAANDALKAFKLQEKERDKQQRAAMEAYANKKAELQAEREAKEAERRAHKEAHREAIAAAIQSNYTAWHTKEENRLQRDVAEAEHKAALDEAARLKRQKDALAAMHRSNQAQLKAKAEQKAAERQEEAEMVTAYEERLRQLKEEEAAEKAVALAAAKKLQGYQQHQADVKVQRKLAQRVHDLHDAAQIQAALQEQDEIFHEYAEEVIREYKAQGKPIVPLTLHLNKKETLQNLL